MAKKPDKEYKDLTTPEERLQYLYREIFYISDKMDQIFESQNEINKLLVNLLKEYKNIKDFNDKYLK